MKKAAPVIIRTDEEIRKDLTALRTALFAARKRTGDDGLSYAVAKHGNVRQTCRVKSGRPNTCLGQRLPL